MSRILLTSNEKTTSAILGNLLKTEGYKVVLAGDFEKARGLLQSQQFSLMILSMDRPAAELVAFLGDVRKEKPQLAVVAIVDGALIPELSRDAASRPFACLAKPLKVDQLLATVQQAVDFKGSSTAEEVGIGLQLEKVYEFENLVAESPPMKSMCEMISRVAATDVTVLIMGEKGTGKETIARAVHGHSRRKQGAFVRVECRQPNVGVQLFGEADRQGLMEKADGGTLFLHEVQELPDAVQAQLVKALQERKAMRQGGRTEYAINVRVVASSSPALADRAASGAFRKELYALLRVISLDVPPLRQRPEDFGPLLRNILRDVTPPGKPAPSLSPDVMRLIEAYPWPGNVDELYHVMKDLVGKAEGGRLERDQLPPHIARAAGG